MVNRRKFIYARELVCTIEIPVSLNVVRVLSHIYICIAPFPPSMPPKMHFESIKEVLVESGIVFILAKL